MRSYGDPSSKRLPLVIRGFYRLNDIAAKRRGPITTELITKMSHADRQVNHPGWFLTYRPNPTVRIEELSVAGRGVDASSGPIRVRVYRPTAVSSDAPLVLYLHGGGFVLGGIEACAWICAEIAAQTGAVVAAVEYRLAPEHPFPAGLEDCRDVLDWLAAGRLPGTDPTRISVAGDSAGGNLSAALCLEVRDSDGPAILHQTLIYPFLDSTLRGQSWRDCGTATVDLSAGQFMVESYGGKEHANPLVSPLLAENLSNLPPALICTSDYDVLRDDGVMYADALRAAGVPVRHTNYIRAPHGLLSMPRLLPVARQMLAEVTGEISRHLTSANVPATADSGSS